MKQVIESCIRHNAKLVFFDNIYMYSKDSVLFMTEDAPVTPSSEKGKVKNSFGISATLPEDWISRSHSWRFWHYSQG